MKGFAFLTLLLPLLLAGCEGKTTCFAGKGSENQTAVSCDQNEKQADRQRQYEDK